MYDGFIKKERGILFFSVFCFFFLFRMSDDDGDERNRLTDGPWQMAKMF